MYSTACPPSGVCLMLLSWLHWGDSIEGNHGNKYHLHVALCCPCDFSLVAFASSPWPVLVKFLCITSSFLCLFILYQEDTRSSLPLRGKSYVASSLCLLIQSSSTDRVLIQNLGSSLSMGSDSILLYFVTQIVPSLAIGGSFHVYLLFILFVLNMSLSGTTWCFSLCPSLRLTISQRLPGSFQRWVVRKRKTSWGTT